MSETEHQGHSEHRFWGYGTDFVSPLQCPFLQLWTGDLKKGGYLQGVLWLTKYMETFEYIAWYFVTADG